MFEMRGDMLNWFPTQLYVLLVWFITVALLSTKKFQENLEIQHKCQENAEFLNILQLWVWLRRVRMVAYSGDD